MKKRKIRKFWDYKSSLKNMELKYFAVISRE